MSNPMKKFKEVVCSCKTCVKMCEHRPCWGTPEEIKKIIDAGYGSRLMMDYWVGVGEEDTDVPSPAIVGYEGRRAPFIPQGRCTFLNAENLCELHDKGLKPLEGRVADCKSGSSNSVHRFCAASFDSDEGREVAALFPWKEAPAA